MATMFYDKDADIELIRGRKVAVIGYGSQGHAHALNLQDSGVDVVVGLQAGSKSADKAKAAGLKVLSVADASKWGDVIMVLIPDQHQARVYKAEIEQHLTAGKMLMFAHGFAVRFNWIVPPKDVDVTMVAPKAPGHRVREVFKEGAGSRVLTTCRCCRCGRRSSDRISFSWRYQTRRCQAFLGEKLHLTCAPDRPFFSLTGSRLFTKRLSRRRM